MIGLRRLNAGVVQRQPEGALVQHRNGAVSVVKKGDLVAVRPEVSRLPPDVKRVQDVGRTLHQVGVVAVVF